MASTGFTFGQTAGTATGTVLGGGTTTGLNFGAPKTTAATGGFTLGGAGAAATPAPSTGFSFGSTTASQPAATTTPSTGFNFGGLGGTTAATTQASTGFTLGGLNTAKTTASTGFTLGAPKTTASTGFSLGGLGGTTASAPSGGFSLGATPTTASTGFNLGGGTAAKPGGLNLGGLLSTSSASTGLGGTTGNIFTSGTVTSSASKGLGGVDPKTAQSTAGAGSSNGKSSDLKAIKETPMPEILVETVEDFKKHIKDQKSVREDIARMSSKCMYKVQEDVASLKQLLSLVSNGLQRNAAGIEKLKWEAARELQNAEMAHRTKDIPQGLQYENTAPTEYYHKLVEDFEIRMQTYRQQIETMESHLACLHQPNKMSPQELVLLLRKIHETFLALAAQLHQVHEAVKTQKDHYLNYRKVFHADDKNVFEKTKKPIVLPQRVQETELGGPSPFTGLSSATAMAMASALNRVHQATGAPPAVGLTGTQPSTLTAGLFGNTGSSTTALGSQSTGLFNTPANTSVVKPMGSSLFGNLSSNTSALGLSAPSSAPTGIATPMPGGATGFSGSGGAPVENNMLFLAKPPVKRGKR